MIVCGLVGSPLPESFGLDQSSHRLSGPADPTDTVAPALVRLPPSLEQSTTWSGGPGTSAAVSWSDLHNLPDLEQVGVELLDEHTVNV